MKIIVHDSVSAMIDLLGLPVQERPDALRAMYEPIGRMFEVTGGMDPVMGHQGRGGLFRIDGDDPRLLPALRTIQDAEILGRMEECLAAAWRRIDEAVPGVKHAETVHVVLVLGHPDDEYLVGHCEGMQGMGGISGSIQLTMWPTEASLKKIPYAATHELHHNVRYSNVVWNPMTVTVGEQVVAEGMAEAFVREQAGAEFMGPYATAVTGPELDRAYDKITAAIDVSGMRNLPAYVHGDSTARRTGQEPVGLPDSAGYAVGLRIAGDHLAATGLSAAQSVALPAADILRNAGVPTNAA